MGHCSLLGDPQIKRGHLLKIISRFKNQFPCDLSISVFSGSLYHIIQVCLPSNEHVLFRFFPIPSQNLSLLWLLAHLGDSLSIICHHQCRGGLSCALVCNYRTAQISAITAHHITTCIVMISDVKC